MLKPHVPQFNLKVNGSQAPKKVMDEMLDCTVENSLHLPDVCTIRIHDAEFEWLDSATFKEGVRIQVSAGEDQDPLKAIFDGEVIALELDLAGHGVPTCVVRCSNRAHRLHRGRKTQTYVQMKDSDIVSKVASQAGFQPDVDATQQVHDWVIQNNQTDWEFLRQMAIRDGFRLYVKDQKTLCFKKITDQGSENIELQWGVDLRSFRPRTSATPQVSEVQVRGWDVKKKEPIQESATTAKGVPQTGGQNGSQVATGAFGEAKMVIVDRPVQVASEAKEIAQSVCDQIGEDFLIAEGLCVGRPELLPGKTIEVKNIAQRFSGKYIVTATVHTYTPSEGYSTQFSISGKRPDTLMALMSGDDTPRRQPLGNNIVVGIVTDNNDPDNMGRVKVKYPWLSADHTSFWARIAVPMAGKSRGMIFMPEVNDEVLLAFEHGDIHRPYVIGALWNGKDGPPNTGGGGGTDYSSSNSVKGGKVVRRWIRTREGLQLSFFDDKDGQQLGIALNTPAKFVIEVNESGKRILLKTEKGHKITVDDGNDQIHIDDRTGQNYIHIDTPSNSIEVKAAGDISVIAGGSIKMQAGKDIEMQAAADIKSTAASGWTVTAGSKVETTSGGNTSLTAGGKFDIMSSAVASVTAPMIKLN